MMTVCWLVGRPIGWLVFCCDKKNGLRDWNGTQRTTQKPKKLKNKSNNNTWLSLACALCTIAIWIEFAICFTGIPLWTGFDTSQWPNHLNKAHKYLHKWLFYGYACVILWQTLALSSMFTHCATNEREAMLSVSIVLPTLSRFIRIKNDLHHNEN